jgi:type II secretory pathway pseudopilin PulG
MVASAQKRKAAFTLIELLVAFLLIAVLSGILLSTVGHLRNRSSDLECVNNVRSITLAIIQYAAENSGRLPDSFARPYQHDSAWAYVIGEYLGRSGTQIQWVGRDYLKCPVAHKNNVEMTYGVNYTGDFTTPSLFAMSGKSGRLSNVRSSTMLVGDSVTNVIYSPRVWPLNNASGDSSTKHAEPYNYASFPHNGKMHIGLADGAVKTLTVTDWKQNAGGFVGP